MKRSIKRISLTVLTGVLCLSNAPCSFAASKAGSGKSELSQYNAELATQRSKLSELIAESRALTKEIIVAQQTAKGSGLINKEVSSKLAEMSSSIKAKRMELTESRTSSRSLRKQATEARKYGDYVTAKDKLIQLSDIQDTQITLRNELLEMLNTKLDFIKSLDGNTDTIDKKDMTDSTDQNIFSEEAPETSNEQTDTDINTDNTEPVSDEELAAAFDDGADLEEDSSDIY